MKLCKPDEFACWELRSEGGPAPARPAGATQVVLQSAGLNGLISIGKVLAPASTPSMRWIDKFKDILNIIPHFTRGMMFFLVLDVSYDFRQIPSADAECAIISLPLEAGARLQLIVDKP